MGDSEGESDWEEETELQKQMEGMGRLLGFSDGVFAIAITLLILNIEVPKQTGSATIAAHQVLAEWPDFLSYVISFLVIGNYWIVHHNMFEDVERYNRGLLWVNIVYLMCIAFIPYSTSLIGDFPGSLPVIIYAGTLTLTGVVLTLLWRYAWRNDLLDGTVDSAKVRDISYRILIPSAIFAGSILVSFVSAQLAMYSWLLLFFADPIRERFLK